MVNYSAHSNNQNDFLSEWEKQKIEEEKKKKRDKVLFPFIGIGIIIAVIAFLIFAYYFILPYAQYIFSFIFGALIITELLFVIGFIFSWIFDFNIKTKKWEIICLIIGIIGITIFLLNRCDRTNILS